MSIKMFKPDELYREYDGLVGLTMLNLHTASKEEGIIRLLNFNRHNKEHLYMLRIALFARDVYGFPIELDCDSWDIFHINWKLRKGFDKVKKASRFACNGVRTYGMLDMMREDGKQRIGENFTFADIYNTYYKGSIG